MTASRPTVQASPGTIAAAAEATRRRVGVLLKATRRDGPLLILVGAFVGSAYVLNSLTGYPNRFALEVSWSLLLTLVVAYTIPGLVVVLAHGVVARGQTLRDPETWLDVLRRFFRPDRLMSSAVVMAILSLFLKTFAAFKASIPVIHPYAWDERFMALDRLVHFGQHPWMVLQGLIGTPLITALLDRVYFAWIPVVWLTVLWQVWHGSESSHTRSQFLLAFAACWIVIGIGAAMLLSSAGPAFYVNIAKSSEPFGPLMQYLHQVDAVNPLHAVETQNLLWQSYANPESAQPAGGISAMPSMHVSMVVLMTLLGFRTNRWLGFAYLTFAILIMIGSVHLAWHYAIDGYVAALLTVSIWCISGWILRTYRGRRSSPGLPQS